MYDYTEFDEIADQIASDIYARDTLEFSEAMNIVRCFMGDETQQIIEGVAVALWRSYQDAEG